MKSISEGMTYQIYKDFAGEWRWTLQGTNGSRLAESAQGYYHKLDCVHAIGQVKLSQAAPLRECSSNRFGIEPTRIAALRAERV